MLIRWHKAFIAHTKWMKGQKKVKVFGESQRSVRSFTRNRHKVCYIPFGRRWSCLRCCCYFFSFYLCLSLIYMVCRHIESFLKRNVYIYRESTKRETYILQWRHCLYDSNETSRTRIYVCMCVVFDVLALITPSWLISQFIAMNLVLSELIIIFFWMLLLMMISMVVMWRIYTIYA